MSLRNLEDLTVFVRVAEARSFSAVARAQHRSPKTVSKQIARLEQALGVTLFERNTRNLKITEEGRAIAERVRVAVAILDEVEELAARGSHQLSGTLRLTAPVPFGRKYVTAAIADFRRAHPQVGFELRLSDQVQDLYGENFDLAIRMGELEDSRLLARRLADNRRVLVASPAYVQHRGAPAHPEELSAHDCLLFAYPGLQQNTWRLSRNRREAAIHVDGTLCSDNGDVLREWCLEGLGISLRETWDVHEELRTGRLVQILPEWESPKAQISAVRVRRDPVPRRLSAFIEFLAERWQDAPWDAG